MMQQSINYAVAISRLAIPEMSVWEAKGIFEGTSALLRALDCPVVDQETKRRIIDRVFPEEMRPVFKVMCAHQSIGCVPEVFEAYQKIICEEKGVLLATLLCHKAPGPQILNGMERFLCRRFRKQSVDFSLVLDPDMLGGFILRAGDWEFDWSIRGRIRRMRKKLTGR